MLTSLFFILLLALVRLLKHIFRAKKVKIVPKKMRVDFFYIEAKSS